jgi:hypothetical protein
MKRNAARFKKRGRSPLRYLTSLQRSDGSFRYSRRSSQTPVWVTAQALVALRRKSFPLKPAAVPKRVPRVAGDDAPRVAADPEVSPSAPKRSRDSKRAEAGEEGPAETDAAGRPPTAPPGQPALPAAEVLDDDESGPGADMGRAALIVIASALILGAVAWWRHRRRADPLS